MKDAEAVTTTRIEDITDRLDGQFNTGDLAGK